MAASYYNLVKVDVHFRSQKRTSDAEGVVVFRMTKVDPNPKIDIEVEHAY